MVPVTGLGLKELQDSLREAAIDDDRQPPHARTFAAWMFGTDDRIKILNELAREAASASGAAHQTAHVAVLGYATNIDPAYGEAFAEGLEWLRQRQYFAPGRPLIFEIDGLGLLGTAVGVEYLRNDETAISRAWLTDMLRRSLQAPRPADWNESLIHAAFELVTKSPAHLTSTNLTPDLKTALGAKKLMSVSAADQTAAWDLISQPTTARDMTRAAAQLAAITYLLRETAVMPRVAVSVEDVGRLLRGVQRSMRRWSWEIAPRTPRSGVARWTVDNEYHVQDMLWAILAPHFPDLDDEEWLKSLGQHHPRADLAIPSLELIVEVKFMRSGRAQFQSVVKEVAADASTYLQEGSGYRHIIAFIWDDEARTEDHAELQQGLTRIPGVRDAIILPRPAKMVRVMEGEF